MSRFLDLNDLKDDNMISIDNLFRDFKGKNWKNDWKPHKKLKDSDNHFIHALFYLITTMIQPFRTTLKWFCSGGLNHGQKQGSISKKHEHSYLYSALWR